MLAWSARQGGVLLGVGVFLGVLVPPLAHLFHPIIAPSIIGLMTLVLLRVDIPAAIGHLRRPGRLAVIVGFHALVCPAIAWAVVDALGLDAGIAAGVVIFATGCAATSGAAFARMVGLDPELSLIATLVTTILVPLTAPPMVYALIGVDLAISLQAFAGRLVLVVGLPLLLSMAMRRVIGAKRLAPHGPAVDGAVLSHADAVTALAVLRRLGRDGLAQHPCIGPERAEFVLPGCAIFAAIHRLWPAPEVVVADRGLREGMLLRMMRAEQKPPRPRRDTRI